MDIGLVRCAELRDVVSVDVVAEPFEAVTVLFIDVSVSLLVCIVEMGRWAKRLLLFLVCCIFLWVPYDRTG